MIMEQTKIDEMETDEKTVDIYGTSHVSHESIQMIDRVFEEQEFDTVALELDPLRLNALLNDESGEGGSLFMRFLRYFQRHIGRKTGVMPGDEMLYAYQKALREGKDVVLIDQDIRVTMSRFKDVSRKEKVKAAAGMAFGMVLPGGMDVSRIPEEEEIQDMIGQMQNRFPEIFRVIYTERNEHMVNALKQLDGDIVAFLGAAHRRPVQEGLE